MKPGPLFLLLSLVACAPRGGTVEATPGPVVPEAVRADSIVESEVFPPSIWNQTKFNVALTVVTVQSDSSASDSVAYSQRVILEPDPQRFDTGVLLFRVDPPVQDSLIADSTQLSVDSTGRAALIETVGRECLSSSPVLTPVLLRQLTYPVSSRLLYRGASYTDSLTYINCIRGVQVRVALLLQWHRDYADSAQSNVPVSLSITGTMSADSSQQFPMNLTGRLTGQSRAVFAPTTLWLDSLRSEIESIIETSAGTRRQSFAQSARYQVYRILAPDN